MHCYVAVKEMIFDACNNLDESQGIKVLKNLLDMVAHVFNFSLWCETETGNCSLMVSFI